MWDRGPRLVGGVLLALLFVMTSTGWPAVLGRLLYDGFAPPPPYRWVRPPLSLLLANKPPGAAQETITFTPSGSRQASVVTEDDQAAVVFPPGAVERLPGASAVEVTITPLDPHTLPALPPGLRPDGNAYRVDAVYLPSHAPVILRAAVSVILRYPVHASTLLRLSGSRWEELRTTRVPVAFQIFAPTRGLGVFVAAGPPQEKGSLSVWLYRGIAVLLWAAAAAVAALLVADYVRTGRRRRI